MIFPISAEDTDLSKNGYKCLKQEIDKKGCSDLSLEENIFSLLSTGKCESQLLSKKKTQGCWGSSSCNIKETAQAIIALKMQGLDISSYVPWLLAQNETSNTYWFLQIDTSNTAATCTINSATLSSCSVTIGENEKLDLSGCSSCFLIDNEYWIEIKPSCYAQEFEISCDKDFSTTLFYKKTQNSPTIHILDAGKSGLADDAIIEQANPLCFGTPCDYEGTLWAAFALDLVEENISPYLPHLIALAEANDNYLPESFLYYLTDDSAYSASLKAKQKADKYWSESGNKYYDTAVALFPLSGSSNEKTNAIAWLEGEQDSDGCWNSKNIVDTAFLLYSLWPKATVSQQQLSSCEGVGECMSSAGCVDAEGNEMNYSCYGFGKVCCDKQEEEPTCNEMGGTICETGEICNVNTQSASDTSVCCVGICEEETTETSECELNSGICRDDCLSGEEINLTYECLETSEFCCVVKTKREIPWLWIALGVLVVLGVVLFIFRKKIFKPKPEEIPRAPARPGTPPRRMPQRRPITPGRVPISQKRILPQKKPAPKPVQPKEDVFKKLKEMGE